MSISLHKFLIILAFLCFVAAAIVSVGFRGHWVYTLFIAAGLALWSLSDLVTS